MKSIKRRGFLSGISGSFASAFAFTKLFTPENAQAKSLTYSGAINEIIENPNDVKLNVKLVFSSAIHSETWQGPCQFWSQSGDEERAAHRSSFKRFVEEYKKNISQYANMLKPEFVEYIYLHKDIRKNEKEFAKLMADKDDVELYIVSSGIFAQILQTNIGKRFNKPVAVVGLGTPALDTTTYLRARGFEGYRPLDFDELNNLINLLRTRKVFKQTKILYPTDVGLPGYSDISSAWDFDDLGSRFGIGCKIISFKILSDEMERVMKDKDEQKKAEKLADKLIKHAQGTYLDRKYVVASAQFYYTVKNLMNRYNCNGFTVECFEFCTSRLGEDWKIVPCLILSLLKDEGYVGSCQGDTNAHLSMVLLQSLSYKTAHMGNVEVRDLNSNIVQISHSVPGTKMNGYNEPDISYNLRNFCPGGWGTKLSINYADNHEKTVTLVNVDPLVKKIMVATGEVVKCTGFDEATSEGQTLLSCSLRAHVKISDTRKYLHILEDFGPHVAMGFGDYRKEFKELGKIIGMEVIEAS